ncbi:MAG: cyclodeaminase/cyclohydrolase family protein [Solirubrobacteraceae bacterium]
MDGRRGRGARRARGRRDGRAARPGRRPSADARDPRPRARAAGRGDRARRPRSHVVRRGARRPAAGPATIRSAPSRWPGRSRTADAPLKVARAAAEIADLATEVAAPATAPAGDAAAGALLAQAACTASARIVLMNLSRRRDDPRADEARALTDR